MMKKNRFFLNRFEKLRYFLELYYMIRILSFENKNEKFNFISLLF